MHLYLEQLTLNCLQKYSKTGHSWTQLYPDTPHPWTKSHVWTSHIKVSVRWHLVNDWHLPVYSRFVYDNLTVYTVPKSIKCHYSMPLQIRKLVLWAISGRGNEAFLIFWGEQYYLPVTFWGLRNYELVKTCCSTKSTSMWNLLILIY